MTDEELITSTISRYMDLQRIKKAADRDRELRSQLRVVREQLEAFGVKVEELTLEG